MSVREIVEARALERLREKPDQLTRSALANVLGVRRQEALAVIDDLLAAGEIGPARRGAKLRVLRELVSDEHHDPRGTRWERRGTRVVVVWVFDDRIEVQTLSPSLSSPHQNGSRSRALVRHPRLRGSQLEESWTAVIEKEVGL